MLILQFIFGFIAVVVLSVIGIAAYLMLKVRHIVDRFSNSGFSYGGEQQRKAEGTKRRSAEYDDGVVVEEELYDERSPREAEKKIFPKDEGEYVDYEDVK